jgi:dipeptidyl aminopeptidase/acylaminoacyl peptidase
MERLFVDCLTIALASVTLTVLLTRSLAAQAAGENLRAITVEDCVRTRRVVDEEVQVSSDGSLVAYVVKAPDLSRNRNNYQLYVRDLKPTEKRRNGRVLLRADRISGLRWLGRRQLMARIGIQSRDQQGLKSGLFIVNVPTGAEKRLSLPSNIGQFSASAAGTEFVFSVKADSGNAPAVAKANPQDDQERGFAIRFGEGDQGSFEHLPEDAVYFARETAGGGLAIRKLYFRESWHAPERRSTLRNVIRLDLSPDGKRLLIIYSTHVLPPGWSDEPYVKQAHSFGTLFDTYVLGLYDLRSAELRLGFNFPGALVRTRWSDDSHAYGVIAPSPFGTENAKAEEEEGVASGNIVTSMLSLQHPFVVDAQTGIFERVLNGEDDWPGRKSADDLPLSWNHASGPLLIRTGENSFAWMTQQDGLWKKTHQLSAWKGEKFLSSLSSDGHVLIGVSQTTMIPADLFAVDLRNQQAALLTDLNPNYKNIRLGKVERLEWTNRYGSKCTGFLIEPVGYEEGTHYPLVFLAAPPQEVFISDAVYTTAFAPQSLAAAGFVVVLAQYPLENKIAEARFPGEVREAYNWMSMVESVIDLLAERAVIDKDRVAIGGFSRTSWLVDFTLTHSTYSFSAASSADSGIYTYEGYFQHNSIEGMKAAETELGGPPYGSTFRNWLDYAPPFQANNVRAAVLMEYTGTDNSGFEFFTALSRLGKAVEFYRYPRGSHPLDTPYERVASLQRNVDWFRFWLQGYEGVSPSYDPDQYARWRTLREQQRWNGRMRDDGKDPGVEFLRETLPGGLLGVTDPAPLAPDFIR